MDVDLPRRRISIRQVVIKVGSEATIKDAPKSEHGYRALDIGPKLAAVLRAREIKQLDERMAAGRDWEDNDLVFTHPTGTTRGATRTLVVPGPFQPPARRFEELLEAGDTEGS